jgi:hypothetical protein
MVRIADGNVIHREGEVLEVRATVADVAEDDTLE